MKRADEACVHRRVCGEHKAEVYLSRDMATHDCWAVRVLFFDAARLPVEEFTLPHPRNKALRFTCKRQGQPDFVMPDPADRQALYKPAPRSPRVTIPTNPKKRRTS